MVRLGELMMILELHRQADTDLQHQTLICRSLDVI